MGLLSSSNIKSKFNEMDHKVINNIKSLAIDMINEAGSGHPGIVLSAAPIIYDIYSKHLVFNNKDDKWINRDRFVLSAGHGSALLYATLFMSGFKLTIDDLKRFRQIDSKTPGHPEVNITPGVDMSTGPLGQGFSSAVGIAISERFLNQRYSYSKDKSLINHYTYVLCGDGDLMEGVSYEAASIAGNLGLGKLIVLYDSNSMTLDNNTKETFKENVLDRFKAMNWDTYQVDGKDLNQIDDAITKAKMIKDKPSIIEVKTILGYGSKLENTNIVHGKPLTEEDISNLKEKLSIRDVPFTILDDAYTYITNEINNRNNPIIEDYNKTLDTILPKVKAGYKEEIKNLIEGKNIIKIEDLSLTENLSGREISNIILNSIVTENNLIIGGSADLASSTKTYIKNMKDFTSADYSGRNILFGVREHAMGAILNGIALSGIRCFGSTFLSFSDYLKPAIRMSALMKLPVIYVFTHDTITIGEDGPTHQPIEQLILLRSIPNVTVYRPGDANEILGAYKSALRNNEGPSILVISKEELLTFENTSINNVQKGAYIVKNPEKYNGIIIATGKELSLAIKISEKLEKERIYARVVSMPSIELFMKQSDEYKEKILPLTSKKAVIEFASSYSWYEFVYNKKYLFTIDSFGYSGKKEDILQKTNLSEEIIYQKIEKLFK